MAHDEPLVRLRPFEGLCLTAADLIVEQSFHRRALERHAHFLHGHGVVQGLGVELVQTLDRYEARVRAGFGLTARGQGIRLASDRVVPLEEQGTDGDYTLWLVRDEPLDPLALRPVFDTSDQPQSARAVERIQPRLVPADEEIEDGVALAHLRVRLGRMAKLAVPVPRAGRVARAAESALKPMVLRFVDRSRRALTLVYRTAVLQELDVASFGFYAAVVAAEFVLLEEGTSDRVLYRAAGSLVGHARGFYDADAVRALTDRFEQVAELVRALDDRRPEPHHDDREWQRWFEQFERCLPALDRAVEELQATVDPGKA
ncbi:MAG: hypothetical protein RLZZ383_2177 [Pseudomonadota bacterium]|jgi:hypothetical protein